MAAKRASLSVNIIADATQARAGFQEAEKAAGGLQTQLTNVGKAVVGAFATQAVFNFAKSAITAAWAARWISSIFRKRGRARCSGIPKAGRCSKRSFPICAVA